MNAKTVGLVAVSLLAASGAGHAAAVTIGSSEWRQLTDTTGFTWNQAAIACPTNGTACGTGSTTGILDDGKGHTVDVSGWTWASASDIRALFDTIVDPGTTNLPPAVMTYQESPSETWINAVVGYSPGEFVPVVVNYAGSDPQNHWVQRYVVGWSATIFTPGYAYNPFLMEFGDQTTDTGDEAALGSVAQAAQSTWYYGTLGVWLRRSAAVETVPEPGTLVLLGLGLAGLGLSRRRKA